MNIKIGKYDVHSSGTVIGLTDEPISFDIENLTFEFNFKNNTEDKEQKVTTKIDTDGKKLILTFYNFNNTLGTGNITPLKVADINSREFFLSYRIYALTDKSGKTLHYTWLLGDSIKKDNDEQ